MNIGKPTGKKESLLNVSFHLQTKKTAVWSRGVSRLHAFAALGEEAAPRTRLCALLESLPLILGTTRVLSTTLHAISLLCAL